MVNDPETDKYIRWSPSNESFIVPNQDDFSREVLPRFFKHNNFTSFIRQLNMYGFHKIPNVQQGSLLSGSQSEIWEFSNENFKKDRPDLLEMVMRRKHVHEEPKDEKVDIGSLVMEMSQIKRQQLNISNQLQKIQRENQAMWSQSLQLQQQYAKQKDTIDKILEFLAQVFSGKKLESADTKKRKLILEDTSDLDGKLELMLEVLNHDSAVASQDQGKLISSLMQLPNQSSLPLISNVPQAKIDTSNVLANQVSNIITSNNLPVNIQQPLDQFSIPKVEPTFNFDPNFNTQNVAEDIDLLQDQIYGLAPLVGIDPAQDLHDWNLENLNLSKQIQGSSDDHQALLQLMENANKPGEITPVDTKTQKRKIEETKSPELDFDDFFNDV
ncbi:stress-responsive transcription factor hsf1 [Boothiomyces macroporosus]|uniref:Stress-responsive transcription factor hsf1 n=1 Tax=Boothiomyces macroporosus TaxID=261099 RepID=A0AAD5Y448_9FUNG|nr:stress-responsive transcription factor hsf1 [Boothiomyces macroporosus]